MYSIRSLEPVFGVFCRYTSRVGVMRGTCLQLTFQIMPNVLPSDRFYQQCWIVSSGHDFDSIVCFRFCNFT